MTLAQFQKTIQEGIPSVLPNARKRSEGAFHAPVRKEILSAAEKKLALANALRYFPSEHHTVLAPEFAQELAEYGRIYMYRFMPNDEIKARPIDWYPAKCKQAAAIMLMIQNNLDPAVAQHPEELITYGGNGAVFSNWAQYRLTMKYLSRPNPLHVFRTPDGPVPLSSGRSACCRNKRDGDSESQFSR